MKAIEWKHTLESMGYHATITNGGTKVRAYRPEDLHKYRDKAEPFAVLTLWSSSSTWRPPQA